MPDTNPLYPVLIEQSAGSDWLYELVQNRLTTLPGLMPSSPDAESACLLADIGEYLVRSATLVSRLADSLARGPHIEEYAKAVLDKMERETGFSELQALEYINKKHSALRQLAISLQQSAECAKSHWQQTEKPPDIGKSEGKRPIVPHLTRRDSTRASMDQWANQGAWSDSAQGEPCFSPSSEADSMVESPAGSNESIHDSIHDQLDKLASISRGKGQYQCPYGLRCTKGGVKSDGGLVNFERNSAYKSHLQKHEKSYKCDLPGCTNKKGFSRRDQLQRHKETVQHRRS